MALIATVSKKATTKTQDKLWNITLNLVVEDTGIEVINKEYSVRYRPDDVLSKKAPSFTKMMRADIDKYKNEQVIFKRAALTTLATNVQKELNEYVATKTSPRHTA